MTYTRSLAVGAALAALAAATIIALSAAAPPAYAHGSCFPFADVPTKNASTGKIRGFGDNYCTETDHTYINVQVCLQKEVNGVWNTGGCVQKSLSRSGYISATATMDCTSSGHSGKYRTRTFGFTSANTSGSPDGHTNHDWSDPKTFSCP
jgi:hypothetical protein